MVRIHRQKREFEDQVGLSVLGKKMKSRVGMHLTQQHMADSL